MLKNAFKNVRFCGEHLKTIIVIAKFEGRGCRGGGGGLGVGIVSCGIQNEKMSYDPHEKKSHFLLIVVFISALAYICF